MYVWEILKERVLEVKNYILKDNDHFEILCRLVEVFVNTFIVASSVCIVFHISKMFPMWLILIIFIINYLTVQLLLFFIRENR